MPPARSRPPISRELVISGAMAIADRSGIAALTMRSLAAELRVQPMSLYHHVANKEAILDAIVDQVFAEMTTPRAGRDWRSELRARSISMRTVLRRHPWAVGLVESRASPGWHTLQHHDAVLGTLRRGGFSVPATAHAYAMLDAYIYGFAVQENSLPFDSGNAGEVATEIAAGFAEGQFPNLVEFMNVLVVQPDYSFGASFEPGLDLVLDAVAALREGAPEGT